MKIPVVFEYEGKKYNGTLEEVHGVGSGIWHLMVDQYYWGMLRRVGDEWFFDESKWAIGHLVYYFREVVIAWYG